MALLTIVYFFVLFVTKTFVTCQLLEESPCPDVLIYERRTDVDDRWYGVITLRTREELHGVFVSILLDRNAELLGNYFGEATSKNNHEFTIRNPNYTLQPGPPVAVRFFVKYNTQRPIPRITTIRLNGRTICGTNSAPPQTDFNTLHISHPITHPNDNNNNNHNNNNNNNNNNNVQNEDNIGNNNDNENNNSDKNNRPYRPSSGSDFEPVNNNGQGGGINRPITGLDDTPSYEPVNNRPTQTRPDRPITSNRPNESNRPVTENSRPNRPIVSNRPNESNRPVTESNRPNRPSNNKVNVQGQGSRPNNNNARPTDSTLLSNLGGNGNIDNNGYGNNKNRETSVTVNGYEVRPTVSSNIVVQLVETSQQLNPSIATVQFDSFNASSNVNGNRRPEVTLTNSEEDFFPGDFNASRRPIVTTLVENAIDNSCGVISQQPRPLITYGKESSNDSKRIGTQKGSTNNGGNLRQWPWHVALYRSKGTDLQYICGGSLITRKHVLTAAHCVTKLQTNRPISPELLQVYLGKQSLRKLNIGVQSMIVEKVIVHPEYNATVFHNDIAILKLAQKASITDYVRTVCLWEEDNNLSSVVDRLGTVVGWGYDETGALTENLMQAQMPVVTTETCIFSNREFFSRFTSSKTYCAGFRNGTSACTGDSGGGMYFSKTSGSETHKVWQIRGVVSLSAALQNERVVCDTSNYIIFTDVAKYLSWIKRTTEAD